MSEIPIGVAALEGVILTVLTHLNNGEVDDAVTRFAEEFRFKDHGIGLEFKDKERLREFFQKKWTLQTTLIEPFYGALSRKVRVSLQGASIVRTDKDMITDWSDYYDGLMSRRTALASYFTEWVEL